MRTRTALGVLLGGRNRRIIEDAIVEWLVATQRKDRDGNTYEDDLFKIPGGGAAYELLTTLGFIERRGENLKVTPEGKRALARAINHTGDMLLYTAYTKFRYCDDSQDLGEPEVYFDDITRLEEITLARLVKRGFLEAVTNVFNNGQWYLITEKGMTKVVAWKEKEIKKNINRPF